MTQPTPDDDPLGYIVRMEAFAQLQDESTSEKVRQWCQ
jgi:hypothetical protein